MKRNILQFLLLLMSATMSADVSKEASPIDAVRGNWFDAAKGGWTLGVYDSVVIANNRIYTTTRALKRGKKIELSLCDKQNGQTETLLLATRRDGTCQLTLGTGKTTLTRKARQPEIPVDNGYKNFLHADTALLQGYIDGYTPRPGFETGLVYIENIFTKVDNPIVVQIAPNGTFSCKLPMLHPKSLSITIEKTWIPFFLEPGHTQTIYINWKDIPARNNAHNKILPLPNICYMGDDAHLSRLRKELTNLPTYKYSDLYNNLTKLTPTQFKESLKPYVARLQHIGDSLAAVYHTSQKAVSLIRNSVALQEGLVLFDFEVNRPFLITKNPDNEVLKVKATKDYYDFLLHMPTDDPEALACERIKVFTNRFEYAKILNSIKKHKMTYESDSREERQKKQYEYKMAGYLSEDSLMERLCNKKNPFLWQVARVRNAKNNMLGFGSYGGDKYINHLRQKTKDYPQFTAILNDIYEKNRDVKHTKSYTLPEGKATDIFRNIIKEHAGKVLFVDFWATTCGPCRHGIETTAELRRKYKNHPEFKFIYITGAKESPKADYDAYVEKNLKDEASYYVSNSDYNYLRQLFKFNGIPHYELVEKDGTIATEELYHQNIFHYLEKNFPLNE